MLDKRNGIDRTTEDSYDNAGNITKIIRQGKGQEAWELRYGYDLKDRITHVEDRLGPVFRYTYDRNDQLREELLPQASGNHAHENRNTYTDNAYGHTLSMTDGAGTLQREGGIYRMGSCILCEMRTEARSSIFTELTAWKRRFALPGVKRRVCLHSSTLMTAAGGMITYRYNSRGKVCEITDQEGHSETFRYDASLKNQ